MRQPRRVGELGTWEMIDEVWTAGLNPVRSCGRKGHKGGPLWERAADEWPVPGGVPQGGPVVGLGHGLQAEEDVRLGGGLALAVHVVEADMMDEAGSYVSWDASGDVGEELECRGDPLPEQGERDPEHRRQA